MSALRTPPTVFISYSRADTDLAAKLRDALADRGVRGWLADDDLRPGQDFVSAMAKALRSADALVAILGETSPQVFYELGCAAGMGKPVVVLVSPTAELPAALRQHRSMPLSAVSGAGLDVLLSTLDLRAAPTQPSATSVDTPPASGEPPSAPADSPAAVGGLNEASLAQLTEGLLEAQGYRVITTPVMTLTSGFRLVPDIIAYDRKGHMLVAEVKAPGAGHWVGVEAIARARRYASILPTEEPAGGIVVTNGRFTAAARGYAAAGTPPIELWDLETLQSMLQEEGLSRTEHAIPPLGG